MLIAASFVKVTMASSSSIHEILFLLLLHKYATLETIEYVFPVPAPASPVPNPWGSVEQPIQPATPEKNKIVLFSVSIFFIVMGVILSIVAFFQPLESLSIMLGAGIAFLSIGVLTLVFRSLKI